MTGCDSKKISTSLSGVIALALSIIQVACGAGTALVPAPTDAPATTVTSPAPSASIATSAPTLSKATVESFPCPSTTTASPGDDADNRFAAVTFAEITSFVDDGIKAFVFENGRGYVFAPEYGERVTFRLVRVELTPEEINGLAQRFHDSGFFSAPEKAEEEVLDGSTYAICFSTHSRSHSINHYMTGIALNMRQEFIRLFEPKLGTAESVTIGEMSQEIDNCVEEDSPAHQCVDLWREVVEWVTRTADSP